MCSLAFASAFHVETQLTAQPRRVVPVVVTVVTEESRYILYNRVKNSVT